MKMKMKMNSVQSGFTLVELIVVIIILAILGAVALPKFIDVTEKAHNSAVKGAAGGLGAAVALFHAQWVANGHTATINDVEGFGGAGATYTVDSNDAGWPVNGGTTSSGAANPDASAATCKAVWDNVMQTPPAVVATTYAAGNDYVATASGKVCNFLYHGGASTPPTFDHDGNSGTAKQRANITYDFSNGAVAISYSAVP